jgi:hypothetical protein
MVTGTVNITGFEESSMQLFLQKGAELLADPTGFKMRSLANNQYEASSDGSQQPQTTIITGSSDDGSTSLGSSAGAGVLQKAGRLVCHLEAFPTDKPGVLKYRFVCEPPGIKIQALLWMEKWIFTTFYIIIFCHNSHRIFMKCKTTMQHVS